MMTDILNPNIDLFAWLAQSFEQDAKRQTQKFQSFTDEEHFRHSFERHNRLSYSNGDYQITLRPDKRGYRVTLYMDGDKVSNVYEFFGWAIEEFKMYVTWQEYKESKR